MKLKSGIRFFRPTAILITFLILIFVYKVCQE